MRKATADFSMIPDNERLLSFRRYSRHGEWSFVLYMMGSLIVPYTSYQLFAHCESPTMQSESARLLPMLIMELLSADHSRLHGHPIYLAQPMSEDRDRNRNIAACLRLLL